MSLDVYLAGNDDTFNISHNLSQMADEAGLYGYLWRPETVPVTRAGELVVPLRLALAVMREDPARFKEYDADNGWGTYEQFLPWLDRLLAACIETPDAAVTVSR